MHGAGASVEDVLRGLAADGQLVDVRTLPGRPATHGVPACPLPPWLAERVPGDGLWSHQAVALDLLRRGASVALATGTASGKSLC